MAQVPLIRLGQVFWLDDCPALDGAAVKRRPVVVVSPPAALRAGGTVVVVAVTTKHLPPADPDAVKLPSKADTPRTTSGLTEHCWALPRWLFPVERERLTDFAGYVSGRVLRQLTDAVDQRLAAAEARGEV